MAIRPSRLLYSPHALRPTDAVDIQIVKPGIHHHHHYHHHLSIHMQVTFTPDGNFLMTGARQDSALLVWDVRFAEQALYSLEVSCKGSRVLAVRQAQGSEHAASASNLIGLGGLLPPCPCHSMDWACLQVLLSLQSLFLLVSAD